MKRVVILLILLPLLCSCGKERKIPLFDSYPITLSGNLTYSGNTCAVTAVIQSPGVADISIESPQNLSGYSFKVDNSSVWVYYDNMQIELQTDGYDIPFSLITEMLSVSREDFEYSRTDKDSIIYYYSKSGTDTAVYVYKDEEIPFRIEYIKDGTAVRFDIETLIVQ